MKINRKTGLLESGHYIESPNSDERPTQQDAELIVIHNISLPPGQFGGPYIEQLFTNQLQPEDHPYFETIYQLHVSSHILIQRDGQIIQFVPFHKRAWHAGESNYCGRERCNDFSIGIELEGTDDVPYEKVQYQQLAQLITDLQNTYPSLDKNAITGHCDIAPERKTDPGPAFNWNHLKQLL
jgi:N-acetyl-anhydromuramoyl-L-alanine amidase